MLTRKTSAEIFTLNSLADPREAVGLDLVKRRLWVQAEKTL